MLRFIRTTKNIVGNHFNQKKLYQHFLHEFDQYNSLADKNNKAYKEFLYPCLTDRTENTLIEPVYFYQDVWAFERILLRKPAEHTDIGSHHKFVAFLSKLTKLTMVDLRPLSLKLDSIKFQKGDILNLPFQNESIDSLSSLCVIEHIGLGRYGDALDPHGSEKAFAEIYRVLKKNAHFYLSLPASNKNIVRFNAGRIFSLEYLEGILKDYIIDDKKFIVGDQLTDEFKPNDDFGTTILLDLIKK